MKLVKSKDFQVRETTKTFYQDEKDTLDHVIDLKDIKEKQIKLKLVDPLSKEIAKELWNERNFELKKEKILDEIAKIKYLGEGAFKMRIFKSKTLTDLDTIIGDLILYTEQYSFNHNQRELEKANPLSVSE